MQIPESCWSVSPLAVRPVWPAVRPAELVPAVRPVGPAVRPVEAGLAVRPVNWRSDRFHEQSPVRLGRNDEIRRFPSIPPIKMHKNHRGSRSAHKKHIYWITISKTHQEFQIGARVFKFGDEHMNPRNKKFDKSILPWQPRALIPR